MKKVVNKNKLWKILIILALIVVAGLLIALIVKGLKGEDEHDDDHEAAELSVYKEPLVKSDADLYQDREFLIESFNEYEDGERFYLAGTNLIDYDKMWVFYGEKSRELIVDLLECNYEDIKDKAADEVLVIFTKGQDLVRLFHEKESEVGFNFFCDDPAIAFSCQSENEDTFYVTKIENGFKKHVLDWTGLSHKAEEDIKNAK